MPSETVVNCRVFMRVDSSGGGRVILRFSSSHRTGLPQVRLILISNARFDNCQRVFHTPRPPQGSAETYLTTCRIALTAFLIPHLSSAYAAFGMVARVESVRVFRSNLRAEFVLRIGTG